MAPWWSGGVPSSTVGDEVTVSSSSAAPPQSDCEEIQVWPPNSLTSTMTTNVSEEDSGLVPSTVDLKRLARLKAEHESRLKMLRTRVDRLTAQEGLVRKDVTWTHQTSIQAHDSRWRRQSHQAEQSVLKRDFLLQEEAKKERARQARVRAIENKDMPRLQKFEENKAVGRSRREESIRINDELKELRQRQIDAKAEQVEKRRRERRQHQLDRELEQNRQQQQKQDDTFIRYAEIQEEIQSVEDAIALAEHDELEALNRLQNSQNERAEVFQELQDEGPDQSAIEDIAASQEGGHRSAVGSRSRRSQSGPPTQGTIAAVSSRSPRRHGSSRHRGRRSHGSLYAHGSDYLCPGGLGQITEGQYEEEDDITYGTPEEIEPYSNEAEHFFVLEDAKAGENGVSVATDDRDGGYPVDIPPAKLPPSLLQQPAQYPCSSSERAIRAAAPPAPLTASAVAKPGMLLSGKALEACLADSRTPPALLVGKAQLDGIWVRTFTSQHSGLVTIKDLIATWHNGEKASLEHVPDASYDFKMNIGGQEYYAKYQPGKLVWHDGDIWQLQAAEPVVAPQQVESGQTNGVVDASGRETNMRRWTLRS